ncbi:MAG: thioesterase II family protein [Frankia sp.]
MPELTLNPDLWLRRFHPDSGFGPDGRRDPVGPPRRTLLCFPHAGGSATTYFPLSAELRDECDVVALQYPGRQDRRSEDPVDDLAQLADRVADVLAADLDGPYAFFGHSMGAVLAFEVALRLAGAGARGPDHLFASGRRAPACVRAEQVHRRDDAGLLRELRSLSGTDARVFDDPDIVAMVLPPVRADYRAIETYRYAPDRHSPGPDLACPITALVGIEDPRVTLDEARRWAEHTAGPFALRTFPGGHFYLTGSEPAVATAVRASLAGPA